jgi:hypothetical protein
LQLSEEGQLTSAVGTAFTVEDDQLHPARSAIAGTRAAVPVGAAASSTMETSVTSNRRTLTTPGYAPALGGGRGVGRYRSGRCSGRRIGGAEPDGGVGGHTSWPPVSSCGRSGTHLLTTWYERLRLRTFDG